MNANANAPSPHVACLMRLYGTIGQGDIPSLVRELSPDMRWHIMGAPYLPQAGEYTPDTLGQFFQALSTAFEFTAFDVQDFIERGDDVIVLGTSAGVARATGKSWHTQWINHWKFAGAGGKPCYFQDYIDTANAAAALEQLPALAGL